jgi:hypothetical protein
MVRIDGMNLSCCGKWDQYFFIWRKCIAFSHLSTIALRKYKLSNSD